MKNLNKNKIAIFGFVIIVAAICIWAVVTKPEPQKDTGGDTRQDQVMDYTGNTIVQEKDGKRIWEVTADNIKMNTQTQHAEMTNIHGKYYDENGKILTITAPHGTYDDKTKNMLLSEGVHAQNDEGLIFDSEKLTWDDKNQVLIGEGKVKIVKDDMKADGDKIESSNGFVQFKLSGNAHIVKGSAKK